MRGRRVGCSDGDVVGRGTHLYDGRKHAEVLAIEEAGERARGAALPESGTVLPHGTHRPLHRRSHRRRNKPRLRGHARSESREGGRGLAKLRAAGIEVHDGLLQEEAKKLNESFAKYIRHKTPFVTLKTAMTLDGKIAPPPGDAEAGTGLGSLAPSGGWITSAVARAHVHEMRHASDAIMVGVGTIIADDPLLTDRTGLPRRRPLQRVVLDSRLRLPLESRVVKTARQDLIVFCCFAEENKRRELEARGVVVEQVAMRRPPDDGTLVFPGHFAGDRWSSRP